MADYRTANGMFAMHGYPGADRTGKHPHGFAPGRDASASGDTVERLDAVLDDAEMSAARLELLAKMMDSAIRIPGTNVVMGFDALLGLVPVVGDAISGAISSYLVWEAKRLGVPKTTLARMAGNVAIDTVLGSVPFVGDLFDVAFKANSKNVKLLRKHLDRQKGHAGRFRDAIDVPFSRM